MRTSHKLTQILLALTTLAALAVISFGQAPTVGVNIGNFQSANQPKIIEVSDQKPGSILVYPYYTSNAQTKADTRITMSNLGADYIAVHVFFLAGSSCQQADQYVCLTKGAQISFKTSDQDPDFTGYIVAVVVDGMGRPISYNALIGNAFVTTPDIVGNYGAEAFASSVNLGNWTAGDVAPGSNATLSLDGLTYDRGADQFAVEIQSPLDAVGQTIVHASLNGSIADTSVSSISQNGTGLLWRGDELQASFVRFISGNCQSVNAITGTAPRVATPEGNMSGFMRKGQIGTLVYATANASVGLLMTPKANAWSGIRTLHKTRTKSSVLTIPVFMPVC